MYIAYSGRYLFSIEAIVRITTKYIKAKKEMYHVITRSEE